MNEVERYDAPWAIYEISLPGIHFPRFILAASLARALAIGVKATERIDRGEILVVQNVTLAWISHSPAVSSSTWSLLREKREGWLDFDHKSGWIRMDPE